MATHNHLCPDCGSVWPHEDFDCETGTHYLLRCLGSASAISPPITLEQPDTASSIPPMHPPIASKQPDAASSGNGIRGFLTGLLALILLLTVWEPPSVGAVPGWVLRIGLILGPTGMAWLILRYVWAEWKPDKAANDRVSRGVAGAVGGALFVLSGRAALAKSHVVGEDFVSVPGPDLFMVFMLALFGVVALWVSIKKPDEDR